MAESQKTGSKTFRRISLSMFVSSLVELQGGDLLLSTIDGYAQIPQASINLQSLDIAVINFLLIHKTKWPLNTNLIQCRHQNKALDPRTK